MAKLRDLVEVVFILICVFQVTLPDHTEPEVVLEKKDEIVSRTGLENSVKDRTELTGGIIKMKHDGRNLVEDVELNYGLKIDNQMNLRQVRSALISNDSLESQFEQHCSSIESQPCTCYYPDHQNVTQCVVSTDEITKNATGVNGTGPISCQDLKSIGYTLKGFYLVRVDSKRFNAIYCNFLMPETKPDQKKQFTRIKETKRMKELSNNKGLVSKRLRFCGGLKSKPCTFYYSDHPDAPQFKISIHKKEQNNIIEIHDTEPTSCEDLQIIGHKMKGFYVVRFNAIQLKIVFCDFTQNMDTESTKVKDTKSTCNGIGSQPCSCYYPSSSKIPKFELSNNEITRNALIVNGTSPTNCKELKSIGHALKGFYIVRISSNIIKAIFCEFEEEVKTTLPTSKPTRKVTQQATQKRYIASNANTVGNINQFNQQIIDPTSSFVLNKVTSKPLINLNPTDNIRFQLKNNNGKCLQGWTDGSQVLQMDCNSKQKQQIWKWRKNHICLADGTCLVVDSDERNPSGVSHWEYYEGSNRQQWELTPSGQLISIGLCLSVHENLRSILVIVKNCIKDEKGQKWSFIWQH